MFRSGVNASLRTIGVGQRCARMMGTSGNRNDGLGSSILGKEHWLRTSDAFIDGEWLNAEAYGKGFDVADPATGEVVATCPDMDAAEMTRAVSVAQAAFKSWRNTTGKERCEILRNVFLLHRENEQELAEILALESGKPLAEAAGEIKYGAGYFEWFAEEAKRTNGDIIPENVQGRKILAFKEPVGVCGLITPWNFPNAMIARKVAPALAAGCTVVIKPAHDTPLSTLAICKMFSKAGLPKGVLNVVTAGPKRTPEVGSALTKDPRVRKISFTGSTRVGQLLMQESAETVKKISMELGGDAPFIVFEDADLDAALVGLMASKFRNAGQTCVASNRVFVQSSVYDKFAKMVVDAVSKLKVGRFDEPDVNIGPLINKAGCDKVDNIISSDVAGGAEVLCGGGKLSDKGECFYAPTVLKDCTDGMRVANEEIFGPVIPLFQFKTEEEVLARANNTTAGLASYLFTKDLGRVFRMTNELEYGMVGCNTGVISTEVAPFGGIKASGLGREGSTFGIDDYLHVKTLTLQLE